MPKLLGIKWSPTARKKLAGPMMKKVAGGIAPTEELLTQMGRIIIREIVREGRRDLVKQGNRPTPVGKAEGIPVDRKFWRSFTFRVKGERTIEILTKWPWGMQILEGRKPYKMGWLTQEKGVHFVPIRQQDGTVVVRTAPKKAKDAWIHPGFAKHRFIERGIKKAEPYLIAMMSEAAVPFMVGDEK